MCCAMPGIALEPQLRERAAAEVDGRARHARRPSARPRCRSARSRARSPSAGVERLAERERRVLGRVVVAGLEVAGALERRGRSRHGRRAARGSGRRCRRRSRRARGAAPSSASRVAKRVSAVARTVRTLRPPATAGPPSASSSRSSSSRSSTETRNAPGNERTTMPRRKQRVGDRVGVVGRHVEEVRVRLERREAERAQPVGEAARAPRGRVVGSGLDASAAIASAAPTDRDRRRRLARVQLGGDVRRRECVADARAGEREQLGERAQNDHAVVEQLDAPSRR